MGPLASTYNLRCYHYNRSDVRSVFLDTQVWIISQTPCTSQNCTVLNYPEKKN